MGNFTTKRGVLFYSSMLNLEEQEKITRFLQLLDDSGISKIIDESITADENKGGRPPYSAYNLMATILYGFAFGANTLRDLEEKCMYDIRYMCLMDQEEPSYGSFCKFINEVITPNIHQIYDSITRAIIIECGIDIDDAFIDGSKFEADANKYKFVWKPTTWHKKLCTKVRVLLQKYDLLRGVPTDEIFSSEIIARKVTEFSILLEADPENKPLRKDYKQLNEWLRKALEYEEKERICGPSRNSYFKTDHDATAMCLKEDYYSGLGSNMHAAYNVQLIVTKGIIASLLVSQSRNDMSDFIPAIDRFYDCYGRYPKRICADSGYGSVINWQYLHDHGIENYVKYSSWQGNVSGRNPDRYILNDNETITCLGGKTGYREQFEGRHPKKAGSEFYTVHDCDGCEFAVYCRRYMKEKEGSSRIFEVTEVLYRFKQEAEQNLLSPKGIEMRVNRSSQAEGAFGTLKQNMKYERIRRTSLEKVTAEVSLQCLGYNIRKLFRHFDGKARFKYWVAPANLQRESFKKPSSKRLAARASKLKSKSANQKNRDQYKYSKK